MRTKHDIAPWDFFKEVAALWNLELDVIEANSYYKVLDYYLELPNKPFRMFKAHIDVDCEDGHFFQKFFGRAMKDHGDERRN